MEKLDKLIKRVRQDRQILAVFLFGSRARKDNFSNSDTDICLVMTPGAYRSVELSRKRLEYLKSFDLDVRIFQQLPIYIRMRVIREGKPLFCADEDQLYQIAFRTIREFDDFERFYRDYLREVSYAR